MNKNDGKMDIPLWPGTEFSMDEPEGKALLGTQIGGPVAWLFIQHKKAFGPKSVVKVCCTSCLLPRDFTDVVMINRRESSATKA